MKSPSEKPEDKEVRTTGSCAIDVLQLVEIGDDAAECLVARVGEPLRQLVVAIAGIGAKRQRIFLRQIGGQIGGRDGVEIRLACFRAAEGLVQDVHDLLLAGVQGFVALAFLLEADHESFLRAGIGNVADLLNGAIRQAGIGEAFANLVDRRRAGEADVDQSAAAEVDAVIQRPVIAGDGDPADGQKRQGEGDEVLRLPHPIDIDVAEEFHAETYPSLI